MRTIKLSQESNEGRPAPNGDGDKNNAKNNSNASDDGSSSDDSSANGDVKRSLNIWGRPRQRRYAKGTTSYFLDELFLLSVGQKAGRYASMAERERPTKTSLLDRLKNVEKRLSILEENCDVKPQNLDGLAVLPPHIPVRAYLGEPNIFPHRPGSPEARDRSSSPEVIVPGSPPTVIPETQLPVPAPANQGGVGGSPKKRPIDPAQNPSRRPAKKAKTSILDVDPIETSSEGESDEAETEDKKSKSTSKSKPKSRGSKPSKKGVAPAGAFKDDTNLRKKPASKAQAPVTPAVKKTKKQTTTVTDISSGGSASSGRVTRSQTKKK